MTEVEQVPTTNGLPEENEEEERAKLRPPDIDADMREMEKRKRVEMIMSSRLFREELERIIESQMKEGGGSAGLLQQIQDMVGGASRLQTNLFRGSNCVLPINDIRGVEAMGYAKGEKVLRCKLSSVFRLMDLYGWSHGIHNLITGRLAQENEEFLVNPHGLMYHEITASSLVKVDMQGNIIEKGTTNFGVNSVSFRLHASLHAARPDIKCVVHVRNPPVLAISSLKCGLLPISAESSVIGEVSSHQYLGSATEPEERDKIARSLGPVNKVLLLSNHGALCCGETIEEAFFNVYNTVLACETQVKLMPLGIDNLISLPDEGRKALYDAAHRAPANDKKWRVGGLEFEALMRMLDNAGFRTGYIYRSPLVKGDLPKPRNDVEVPPAVSSLGYLLEEEEMYKHGNWKKGGVNRNDRSRWLNSPNVYQKVEILETGTTDPKKITKWVDANNAEEWVTDGSPAHTSTPVKIDAALQFVPKNTNPKEFKKLQQQIKENRRADKITSGPQSHILEGVTWEEAKKLQDANISMTGDQVILVGAASKGIIQRGFQNNATVYKSPYAKNPFDQVSEQELEEYKSVVTKKQKGEYYGDDTEQSESEALSSSAALIKSEQEDTSEPQVLRIETKTAPAPSQAEVVLSDDDLPDPHVERSKSQRYPSMKVPDVKRSSSADRARKDGDGVGQILTCRLIDSESLASKKLHCEYQSTETQTSPQISVCEDSPSVTHNNSLKSASKSHARDVPDIIKTNPRLGVEVSQAKVLEELNELFKKRMAEEIKLSADGVEEESITFLPPIKPLAISGSPTGFSSDGTSVSLELNHDEVENIKHSITSLEEHIGQDYEGAFESDSSICGLPKVPEQLFYPDLTASYFRQLYNGSKSLERVNSCELLLPDHRSDVSLERRNSCESLVAEQDTLSVRTYVSSPDRISMIGCEDTDEDEHSSSSSLEFEEDEVATKIAKFKLEGSISINISEPIRENNVNKLILTLIKKNKTAEKPTDSLEDVNTESDSTLSKTDTENTVISVNYLNKNNGNTCLCNSFEKTQDHPSKIFLDINENNSPFAYNTSLSEDSLSPNVGETPGYEGDLDKTLYSSFSFSSVKFDSSPLSPSGYEADNEELSTSFSYAPNTLYTILEEELPHM